MMCVLQVKVQVLHTLRSAIPGEGANSTNPELAFTTACLAPQAGLTERMPSHHRANGTRG